MGAIITVPLVLFCAALWGFIKFPPPGAEKRALRLFNLMVLTLCFVLWFIWHVSIGGYLTAEGMAKYKLLFGLGGGACGALVYVVAFFFIRNFYVFRGDGWGRKF